MEILSITTIIDQPNVPKGTRVWVIKHEGQYFMYAYLHESAARRACERLAAEFPTWSRVRQQQLTHFRAALGHLKVSTITAEEVI